MKACCAASRRRPFIPPWYATAPNPTSSTCSAYSSVVARVGAYRIAGFVAATVRSSTASFCSAALSGRVHVEEDVGSVEAGHDDRRVAHVQARDDLLAYVRRRRSGECEHRWAADSIGCRTEPEVVGPEVVTPRRDAVRLVDDEQGGFRRGDGREDLVPCQLLGSDEEELGLPRAQRLVRSRPFAVALVRADAHCAAGRVAAREQGAELIALQSQQRRDHDRGTVEQQCCYLVDRRLARTRRHDDESVPAAEERADTLLLLDSKGLPTEDVMRDSCRPIDAFCHAVLNRAVFNRGSTFSA